MKLPRPAPVTHPPLEKQVLLAAEAMVRYALASGLRVPASVVDTVRRADTTYRDKPDEEIPEFEALLRAHAELVRIVAPATPRTILLISDGRRSRLSMLGPVRLVRHMLIAVVVLLVSFVLLAMSPDVNARSGDPLTSGGWALLINELFFIALGGLGAAFSALFTAYRYISDGTYDPKYESTYWLRFILGLMAGLLLPALIPIGGDANDSTLTKPLLALLGGFSAAMLYRVLERLVNTVESLVRGDSRELRAAEREAVTARAAADASRERLGVVAELRRLQDRVRGEGDAGISQALDELVQALAAGPPDRAGPTRARRAARGPRPAGPVTDVSALTDNTMLLALIIVAGSALLSIAGLLAVARWVPVEVTRLSNLMRDTAPFPAAARLPMRRSVFADIDAVVRHEWRSMADGAAAPAV